MQGDDSSGTALCRPLMEGEGRSWDGVVPPVEPIEEMDDSRLVGVPVAVPVGSVTVAEEATVAVDVEVKGKEGGDEKRKRGRPPRGQAKPPPPKRKKKEEEDVCFICFDGGSLVLCDRRGCPKAYHPACIKRDEAFFRSRAKWNCGWHICSICQKAAHYMCYTCTYSLCKACIRDADFLCVRDKGFCTTCMRTVMLIENNDQGNKEMAQVDFDDKSSWEYLFKVYWIYLKEKLSLTLDELTQAKNPQKASGIVAYKGQALGARSGDNDCKSSSLDNVSTYLEENDSKKRRTKEQLKLPNNENYLSTDKLSNDKGTNSAASTYWASKELLGFVAHMKNGDTSVLSQFDVQGLLLEYIKRNNLRDPRRKSQIICDSRLKTLFAKQRVGHIEMLKLLEFHFLTKEDTRKDAIHKNIVDAVLSQVEGGGNSENQLMVGKDKKRKTRRKGEEKGPQTNLDEYAAIDVHNINLIYLRRNLMESLIVDNEKFHEKVVGKFVRIRISGSDQKLDLYRLVQVVGTCKVAVPYKAGEKMVDDMLEILNLDKKETVSIDAISNQDFSEEECRRLRQSMKCGLVKRLTVGQILEKAMVLQEVRVNDWLETEKLRLKHLRDRASEKGHRKELRECVEKLELLKTPEERQRRLHETPEVHADPNMDPNCISDDDDGEVSYNKQDEYIKPKFSGLSGNGRDPISSANGLDSVSKVWKRSAAFEQSRNMSSKYHLEKEAPSRIMGRMDASSWPVKICRSNSSEKPGNQGGSSALKVGDSNNQAVLRSGSSSGGASGTSIASLSNGSALSANDSETEKLWHYRDPNGKIQGPFCMVQLRKWSTTGYFPHDMRVWAINDEEADSLLLTDVLNGKSHKVFPLQNNVSLPSWEVTGGSDSRLYCSDDVRRGTMNTIGLVGQGEWGHNGSTVVTNSHDNNELVKDTGWASHSSNWTAPPVNNRKAQTGSSQYCDLLKVNGSYSDQPQVHCPVPSFKLTTQQNETSVLQERNYEAERWNSGPNHGTSSLGSTRFQITGGLSHENQSDSQDYSGQSCGESWRSPPAYSTSKNRGSNSSFISVAKSTDLPNNSIEIDITDLPSPTPKTSNRDLEGQNTKNQQFLQSNFPVQDSGITKLPSPTPEPNNGDEKVDSCILGLPSTADERVDSSIQNLSSSPPKPSYGDGKTDTGIQTLPSPDTPRLSGGDKKADSSTENLPSFLLKLSDQNRNADSSNENLPNPPPKPLNMDDKVDSSMQNLPSSLSKPLPEAERVDSSVQNLPSSLPEPVQDSVKDGKQTVQVTENKMSVSSDFPVQDSGRSWSSASSLVVDGRTKLPEVAEEWGGSSPSRTKPSAEEWDSGLVSVSSLKPPEVVGDHASTPTSKYDQLTSSPLDPATNACSSQEIFTEPIEFSTLDEESVSDLLAEVDAMESQCGLGSPTSVMYSGEEFFQDSRNDCFIDGLSPPLDSGKSDASSSTGNMPLPHESTMTYEVPGASQADVPVSKSGGQSSTSTEVEVETQRTDVSLDWSEAGSSSQVPASYASNEGNIHINPKPMNSGRGTLQGMMNLGFEGSTQGPTHMGRVTGLVTAQGNANVSRGTAAGFTGWDSQPKYGADRVNGSRDGAFQGWDSGFGRGRPSWNRQSPYGGGGGGSGGGGGGSYSRPLPKGQRVCKFYENGRCKKGAFCDYLHPS